MVESASALTFMIPAPCACMTSPLLSTHGAPGTITDSPRTVVHRASESTKEMMYPWIRVMLTGTQRPPCCVASFVVRIRLCGKALELSREVAFVAPVIGSHVHMLRIASTFRAPRGTVSSICGNGRYTTESTVRATRHLTQNLSKYSKIWSFFISETAAVANWRLIMEAFQLLSRGGASFDKSRCKEEIRLFNVCHSLYCDLDY